MNGMPNWRHMSHNTKTARIRLMELTVIRKIESLQKSRSYPLFWLGNVP